jgi:hypothetical protein
MENISTINLLNSRCISVSALNTLVLSPAASGMGQSYVKRMDFASIVMA